MSGGGRSQAEAVADAVTVEALEGGIAAGDIEEGTAVGATRGGAVGVDADDAARVVGRRAALGGGEVFRLVVAVQIAEDGEEFLLGGGNVGWAEDQNAAVVIGAGGGGEGQERLFIDEGGAGPGEAADAVVEDGTGIGGVAPGAGAGVEEVDEAVGGELGIGGEAEEPAFTGGVDGQVEDGSRLKNTVGHAPHAAVGFLGHEQIAGAEEDHGGGGGEGAAGDDDGLHDQLGIDDGLGGGRDRGGQRGKERGRQNRGKAGLLHGKHFPGRGSGKSCQQGGADASRVQEHAVAQMSQQRLE